MERRSPAALRTALVAGIACATVGVPTADARITRIEITQIESPAFGGASFGAVGAYEKLIGRAFGEVDPRDPQNRVITDIELAPRNARGMVEYVTDVEILRPVDRNKGNGVLLFNVVNRGNKHGIVSYNADVPMRVTDLPDNNALKNGGDGWMMRRSEERRVGKECLTQCRSRWSPYH